MQKKCSNPIGLFDSGVGGLSVALSMREHLGCENAVYFADSAFLPYGEQSNEFIIDRCFSAMDAMLKHEVKAVVIACNTATVTAIKHLRARYSLPIIGVEPGVKPACSLSQNGKIAVLATRQTLATDIFGSLINRFANDAEVFLQACPGWVELVEMQRFNDDDAWPLLEKTLAPLLRKGVDTLVMGCTHYAFLTPLIQRHLGAAIRVVNTFDAVTRQLDKQLEEYCIKNTQAEWGQFQFFSSDPSIKNNRLFSLLWGQAVHLRPWCNKA